MIEELEERVRQARRLKGTALEVFLRRLKITAHKGSQANWETKTVCVEVKAELKRLKEAVEAWVEKSDADVNQALRERLVDFLQRYEAQKAKAPWRISRICCCRRATCWQRPSRSAATSRRSSIASWWTSSRTPTRCRRSSSRFCAEDPSTAPAADWRQVQLLPGKLFVVGDPKQTIYRFRRADFASTRRSRRWSSGAAARSCRSPRTSAPCRP